METCLYDETLAKKAGLVSLSQREGLRWLSFCSSVLLEHYEYWTFGLAWLDTSPLGKVGHIYPCPCLPPPYFGSLLVPASWATVTSISWTPLFQTLIALGWDYPIRQAVAIAGEAPGRPSRV